MKKLLSIILVLVYMLSLVSCKDVNKKAEITSTVTRDTKYNSATVGISPEEFEAAGFKLGDSIDLLFGNGYSITDVPFYNGYYVKNNYPVIVAYPGFTYICVTYNNAGIWDAAKLTENETVTFTLNEAGKYSDIQEALGQVYSFDYSQYDSPEQFCNFRPLSGGNLKEDLLFRGASPVDNSRCRAPYTDKLLETNGIAYVVDLADSEDDMQSYIAAEDFKYPYTKALYDNNKVVLLDMSSSYQSEAYHQKVAKGLRSMMVCNGPVYIHCMEGKDRTGFVCMLIEALAGASYEEMQKDYMKTYENYYSVSQSETPEKYEAITELYFDPFMSYLHGTEDQEILRTADYVQDATAYLIDGGMTEAEVSQLIAFISK